MSNKIIESRCLERFRKFYVFPDGEIIHGDKPDFIIRGTRTIGLELTLSFISPGGSRGNEQQQQKLRNEVVSKAQKIYYKGRSAGKDFHFYFNKECHIKNKTELVSRIVHLAAVLDKCPAGPVQKDIFQNIPELDFIYVNTELYHDAKWQVRRSFDGSYITRQNIINILDDKDVKARQYEACDEFWLLIVIDSMNPAQDQEIPPEEYLRMKSVYFKKVFIFKTGFPPIEVPLEKV